MRRLLLGPAVLVLSGVVLTAQAPSSTDWPQWRGPNRDGISRETGLLQAWPKTGPPLVWSAAELGAGFGSVAVRDDRVFVQGLRGRQSIVTALQRSSGKPVWSKVIGEGRSNDRGPGPRGTPTLDADRLYVLTENGDLACLRVQDGTRIWQRNILADFRGDLPNWLISESPLVDGNLVIVSPGGRDAAVVALDKLSGKTVWQSRGLSDEASYASAIVADVHGIRTVIAFTGQAGVGLRLSDGSLLWRYREPSNRTANAATPIYADGRVFYTSNYGVGAGLLALRPAAGGIDTNEVYFTRDMQNHHGGVVLVDGYLYGYNNAILTCLEFATGKMMWRDRSVGKGAITYADGHLYIVGENQTVGLVEATPAGYREKGRFTIKDEGWNSWAHPVVAGGTLFIRNQGTLTTYDVRAR